MTAKLTLTDMTGRVISHPKHDEPIRLQVDLADVVTGRPPTGLQLSGWIRRADRINRSCEEEAQAFRVTRSIALGAIDLNGVVIAVLNEDSSLGVIDPKLDGQPANMLGAAVLGRMPDDFEIDRAALRALLSFADEGIVEEVSLADGARKIIASGLKRPTSLIATPNGEIWVAEKDGIGLLGVDGTVSSRLAIRGGNIELSAPKTGASLVGAVSESGSVLVLDGSTGRIIFEGNTSGAVAAATFLDDEGLLTLGPGENAAQLRYLDNFSEQLTIPLGFAANRLAVSPDRRIALAFTPGLPALSIIDVATARVVQTAELRDATIAEVAFTDRAAFIATREGAYLAVLDLKSVKAGLAATLRPVPLGGKGGGSKGERRLLVSMLPAPQALVVDRDNHTGWIVPELAAVGNMPPMESTNLRGGTPLQVHVVDRSFREISAGRFETVTRIGAGGRYELVLTTGVFGLTVCMQFEVDGPGGPSPMKLYRLAVDETGDTPTYRSGRAEDITVVLSGEDDRNLDVDVVRLLVPSLTSSWSTEVVARRGADGRLRATVTFPHPGTYAIQPVGMPKGWRLKSTPTVEVAS
ncbi:hypothetical protein [Mesorhizobium sp. A623]